MLYISQKDQQMFDIIFSFIYGRKKKSKKKNQVLMFTFQTKIINFDVFIMLFIRHVTSFFLLKVVGDFVSLMFLNAMRCWEPETIRNT